MTCDSILTMASAAAYGLGVALLPSYLGRVQPALVKVDFDTGDAHNIIWVLTHQDLANAARIHTFIDFMADALQATLDT